MPIAQAIEDAILTACRERERTMRRERRERRRCNERHEYARRFLAGMPDRRRHALHLAIFRFIR